MILSVEPGEGGGTTAENANNPQTASPPPNNNSENISNNKENMDSSNSPDLSKSGGGDPIRVISNANSNSENIQIMKNLHEYKASFPLVSDDFVKNCIFQYGRDHDRCMEILKEESDRLRMGPVNRRFSLQGNSNSNDNNSLKNSLFGIGGDGEGKSSKNCFFVGLAPSASMTSAASTSATSGYHSNYVQRRNSGPPLTTAMSLLKKDEDEEKTSICSSDETTAETEVTETESSCATLTTSASVCSVPTLVVTSSDLNGDEDDDDDSICSSSSTSTSDTTCSVSEQKKEEAWTTESNVPRESKEDEKFGVVRKGAFTIIPLKSDPSVLILGRTSSLSAAYLDMELPSEEPEDTCVDKGQTVTLHEEEPACSVSLSKLTTGELHVLRRTSENRVIPIATTSFTTLKTDTLTVSKDGNKKFVSVTATTSSPREKSGPCTMTNTVTINKEHQRPICITSTSRQDDNNVLPDLQEPTPCIEGKDLNAEVHSTSNKTEIEPNSGFDTPKNLLQTENPSTDTVTQTSVADEKPDNVTQEKGLSNNANLEERRSQTPDKDSTKSQMFYTKDSSGNRSYTPPPRVKSTVHQMHSTETPNISPQNPFRKLFSQRKQFYQAIIEENSPKTLCGARCKIHSKDKEDEEQKNQFHKSSSTNRMLRKTRSEVNCVDCHREVHKRNGEERKDQEGEEEDNRVILRAEIEPFVPFTLCHDISGKTPAKLKIEVDLKDSNNNETKGENKELELSPDGQSVKYSASTVNSEEGTESHLEVSLAQDGTGRITTRYKRLGSPNEISNDSYVKVSDGGKVVNIKQSQLRRKPIPAPSEVGADEEVRRPSLMLSGSTSALPSSASMSELLANKEARRNLTSLSDVGCYNQLPSASPYCSQPPIHFPPPALSVFAPFDETASIQTFGGFVRPFFYPTSTAAFAPQQQQMTIPFGAHNSLPNMMRGSYNTNMSSIVGGGGPTAAAGVNTISGGQPPNFPSHPADEEKRIAFTRALLSHQMEQRLRLDKVIRAEKDGYMSLAGQVSDLEMRVKKRDLRIGGPFGRKSEVVEKKENLNKDIGDLQKSCDKLVNQVNSLTEGTVPLGETSIEFYESLRTSTSTSSDAESRARSCTPNNDLPRDIESPRSPQPQHRHSSSVVIEEVQDEDDSPGGEHDGARAEAPQWPCTQCTFLNHPALARCEQCEMPRLVQGTRPDIIHQVGKPCFCHPQEAQSLVTNNINTTNVQVNVDLSSSPTSKANKKPSVNLSTLAVEEKDLDAISVEANPPSRVHSP